MGACEHSTTFSILPVQTLLGTIFHLSEKQQPGACRAVNSPTLHVPDLCNADIRLGSA